MPPPLGPRGLPSSLVLSLHALEPGGKYQQMSVIGQVQGQPDLVLHFASPQVGSGMESLAMHAECHLQDSHWQADGLRNRWVVLES